MTDPEIPRHINGALQKHLLRLRTGRRGRRQALFVFNLSHLLVRIDGKQHEMIEAVAPEVVPPMNVQIKLRAFGQPEFGVGLLEEDWAIFDGLMFIENLELRNRPDQFRFDADDLECTRRNPGAPLQLAG